MVENFSVVASKINKLFGISRHFVNKNNLREIAMGIGPIGEEAFLPFIVSWSKQLPNARASEGSVPSTPFLYYGGGTSLLVLPRVESHCFENILTVLNHSHDLVS